MDYDRTNIPAAYDRGRDHGPELLPDRARLRAVFETAGFRCSQSQVVMQAIAPTWEAYADKLAAGADSVLARVSDDELSNGLDAVRRHDPGPHGRAVIEPIDAFFFRVTEG